MITYDENGLATQTQVEVRDELFESLDGRFGFPLHRDPTEDPLANVVEAVAELEALTQQALLSLHSSLDPNGARGRPLDARVGLTGTTRDGATRSQVDGLLTFTGAATVPNGARYRHGPTSTIWEVTDGPHVAVGAGTIAATLTAIEPGPLEADAASSWANVTVIANVTGFTNPSESAIPGRQRELDVDLRRRRNDELYAQGQGPLAAVQGAVSDVDGVIGCRAYHNPSTFPEDANGIPLKAINVVVETSPAVPTGDQQDAIRAAIWSALGGGGEAFGTSYTGTVTDTEGVAQPVAFDVVANVDIWIEIDLVTTGAEVAITPNIENVVAAAVLALATASYSVAGRDVLALDYSGEVARLQALGLISGVVGVNVRLAIDPDSPAPVTSLAIGIREKPAFDALRIAVAQT